MEKKTEKYWTKEKCQKEALKYNYRKDFKFNCATAYKNSCQNGWLNEICSHMIILLKPGGYWTKEKCQEEALKYEYRKDFQKYSASSYVTAHRNKWLDDICNHMKLMGNRNKKCIYALLFNNNHIYIGLTYNINKRYSEHGTSGRIFKYMQKTKLTPTLLQLTDYIDVNEAKIKEGEYVQKYKNEGWKILNKAKTGAIGGNILIWTYDKCKEEALKYITRTEFFLYNQSAYYSAIKNKWLDKICTHMIEILKSDNYWTKEKCHEESIKYICKTDFKNNCGGAYYFAFKHKFLNEICDHMPKRYKKIN